MEEKKLNEQESLALITSMINDTRERLAENSGRPFLIWGYTSIAVSMLEYAAITFAWNRYWVLAWWLIPIIGHTLMWLFCRKKEHTPKSYIDRSIESIWIVTGGTCLFAVIGNIMYGSLSMLLFSVVLLIGTGVTITGLIIKDFTTAFVGSIASVFSLAFPIVHQFQLAAGETGRHAISTNILIFVAIFFVVLVIPGHILNCKNRKNKRCSKR
jgi:hypothetical protein